MQKASQMKVENLDHLGLIAGLIDEIGIVQKITDSNQLDNSSINHQTSPIPIQITYGYSRDHRPDLKQFILDLICSGDGDVPLFLRVASGNESD